MTFFAGVWTATGVALSSTVFAIIVEGFAGGAESALDSGKGVGFILPAPDFCAD